MFLYNSCSAMHSKTLCASIDKGKQKRSGIKIFPVLVFWCLAYVVMNLNGGLSILFLMILIPVSFLLKAGLPNYKTDLRLCTALSFLEEIILFLF